MQGTIAQDKFVWLIGSLCRINRIRRPLVTYDQMVSRSSRMAIAFVCALITACVTEASDDRWIEAGRAPLWPLAMSGEPLRQDGHWLYVRWTEQVQLSDGRVIVAERADQYLRVSDPGSGWGRGGWLYWRGGFRAALPEPMGRIVEWEGTLQPLVLDFIEGQIYFVGAVAARVGEDDWKLSRNERYVIFRLSVNGWQRVTLAELPRSSKPTFLADTREFFEKRKSLVPGSLIDLATKNQADSNSLLSKELRMIVRPVEQNK